MLTRNFTILCAIALLMVTVGCEDSVMAPVPVDDGNGNNNHNFPVPSGPYEDVPGSTDMEVLIRPHTGTFKPEIADAYGPFQAHWRVNYGSWQLINTGTDWTSKLDWPVPAGHVLLKEHGAMSPAQKLVREFGPGVDRKRLTLTVATFPADVYVKRERQWVLQSLEGGAGDFLVLPENTEATFKTTVMTGSSVTETETFGETLTVSGGLSIEGLSAEVEKEMSRTFSTAVTHSTMHGSEFSQTVRGEAGKLVRYQLWSRVDTYTFCDADGNALTHPNIRFGNMSWTDHGSATSMQVIKFNN